jgi:hypothetical protein
VIKWFKISSKNRPTVFVDFESGCMRLLNYHTIDLTAFLYMQAEASPIHAINTVPLARWLAGYLSFDSMWSFHKFTPNNMPYNRTLDWYIVMCCACCRICRLPIAASTHNTFVSSCRSNRCCSLLLLPQPSTWRFIWRKIRRFIQLIATLVFRDTLIMLPTFWPACYIRLFETRVHGHQCFSFISDSS